MSNNQPTLTERLRRDAQLRASAVKSTPSNSWHTATSSSYSFPQRHDDNEQSEATKHPQRQTKSPQQTTPDWNNGPRCSSNNILSSTQRNEVFNSPFASSNNSVVISRSDLGNGNDNNIYNDNTPGQRLPFASYPIDSETTTAANMHFVDSQRRCHHVEGIVAPPNAMPYSDIKSATTTASQQHVVTPSLVNVTDKARDEWRQHGTSKTQALQELRHAPSNAWVVRLVRAESRVDLAGAEYTVYVIEVVVVAVQNDGGGKKGGINDHAPSRWTVERRYSDFEKLQQTLEYMSHGDTNGALHNDSNSMLMLSDIATQYFPSKHWAGRLGHWTPSRIWAPAQYAALIQQRLVQLDAWLVHVVYFVCQREQTEHNHDYNHTMASPLDSMRDAVHQFLTTMQPAPPCERVPHLSSPRDNGAAATMSTESASTSAATDSSNVGTSTSMAKTSLLQRHNPITFTIGSAIRQATATISHMCHHLCSLAPEAMQAKNSIPIDLLQSATGLLFLTVVKAGMMVSGRVGTGLLIAKLPSSQTTHPDTHDTLGSTRWSAPVAIGTVGLGWGALIGGDVTHSLIILTTPQAVADFANSNMSTLCLGAELDVAVGPTGRSAAVAQSATPRLLLNTSSAPPPYYAYAISAGLFVGMSLEGSVLRVRHDVNAKFYGRPNVSAAELLLYTPGVPAAQPLYDAIDQALQYQLPETAFRPSRLWQPNHATMTTAIPTPGAASLTAPMAASSRLGPPTTYHDVTNFPS